jgi:ATP synthase protein I
MQQDQLDSDHADQKKQQQRQDLLSRKRARWYLKTQLVMTLIIPGALAMYDQVVAYSALAGGVIATIANAWFTYRVYRVSTENAARTILASIYIGEVYKIVLTAALFICAFVLIKPVNAFALLLTYFLVHTSPFVMNLFGRDTRDIEYKRESDG